MLIPEHKKYDSKDSSDLTKSQKETRLNVFKKIQSIVKEAYPDVVLKLIKDNHSPNARVSSGTQIINVNMGLVNCKDLEYEGFLVLICHEINHMEQLGAGTFDIPSSKYCEKDCDYYGPKLVLRRLLKEPEISPDFKVKARNQIQKYLEANFTTDNSPCGYGTLEERMKLIVNGLYRVNRNADL